MSKAGTCAKYTKEVNSFKIVMYLLKYHIVYSLSSKFGCKNKRVFYVYVIKGLFQFKSKYLNHWFRRS